jgi:hypothetical protein
VSRVRAVLLALALPACGLAAPAGSAASAPVAPFEARYEVRRNGDVLGEAHLRLSNDAEGWRFESRTTGTRGLARMLGLRIEESSRFVWNAEGRPETREYRYVQSTGVQRRERGVRVDPAADRIRLHDREHSAESPLVAGVVDRQLLTVALMQAVAEGRRGDQVLPVAGRRRVEAQTWRIGAAAAVPGQPAGTQGVVVEMIRESPDGRSTRIWLDPYPPHAPLRIEQREDDGEFLEMRRLAG